MTTYTITPEQFASILTASKQLIDRGDEKAASTLSWALNLQPDGSWQGLKSFLAAEIESSVYEGQVLPALERFGPPQWPINVALLADLQQAARTLRRYEGLHRAKGTPESTEKAEANCRLAKRFEATILRTREALEQSTTTAPEAFSLRWHWHDDKNGWWDVVDSPTVSSGTPEGFELNVYERGFAPADAWRWQGDGSDNIASMSNSMQVLIPAGQLRALFADSVPMPQSAEQAAAMLSLGHAWLSQHAPDRLRTQSPLGFVRPGSVRPLQQGKDVVTAALARTKDEMFSMPIFAQFAPALVVVPADADADEMNRQHGEDYGKDWVYPPKLPLTVDGVAQFIRDADGAFTPQEMAEGIVARFGTTPAPSATLINGLTETETNATASVAGLSAASATSAALPNPGSPEASAMIDSKLAEYNWPSNPKNAARAGFEAARALLGLPKAKNLFVLDGGDEKGEIAVALKKLRALAVPEWYLELAPLIPLVERATLPAVQPEAETSAENALTDERIDSLFADHTCNLTSVVDHRAFARAVLKADAPVAEPVARLRELAMDARKLEDCLAVPVGDAEAILREAIAIRPPAPEEGKAKPELTVWFGSMPESNGRENWTVTLRRKARPDSGSAAELHHLMSGIQVYRSEYKDRARYEADRLRFLLGEIDKDPYILDYDGDLRSAYVEPITFEAAVRPAIKWLNYNCNPHASIIVTPTSAELVTGEKTFRTEEFLKD